MKLWATRVSEFLPSNTRTRCTLRLCLFHSRFSSSLPDLILVFIGGRFSFACYQFMARLLLSGFPLHGHEKKLSSEALAPEGRKIRGKKQFSYRIRAIWKRDDASAESTSPRLFVMRKRDIVSGRRLGMRRDLSSPAGCNNGLTHLKISLPEFLEIVDLVDVHSHVHVGVQGVIDFCGALCVGFLSLFAKFLESFTFFARKRVNLN